MPMYCRAYRIGDLRAFREWTDSLKIADDTFVYLWEDFTVVRNPVRLDETALWDNVTPQWKEFCATRLGFAVPEDLADAGR